MRFFSTNKHLKIETLAVLFFFSWACEQKEKVVYVEVEKEVVKEVEKAGTETPSSATTETNSSTESTTTSTTTSTTSTTGTTSGALTLVNKDVTLEGEFTIGSLAINLDDNNRSLKVFKKKNNLRARSSSDAYKLFCATFEDDAKACTITLTEDGSYSGTCEDFAGTSFGCFLRNGDVTLTTLEFGGDTSLVSGAGTIKSAIVYDPDKKSAQAVVDEENSSALAAENVAEALKANQATTTEIGNITGGWKLTCVENTASGMNCDETTSSNSTNSMNNGAYYDPAMTGTPGMGMNSASQSQKALPDSLYLSVFDQGKKVALWESKERHDICISSTKNANGYYKELEPQFGLNFDSILYPFRFDNRELLDASIDKAVLNLEGSGADGAEVVANVIELTDMRNSWVLDQCKPENNPYADVSRCKLTLEKTETSSYTDYYTKAVISYSWTTWPSEADFDDANFAYTGTIRAESTDCTFDISDGSGKPFCPQHADSTGAYTTYYGTDANGNDARLMLACKLSYTYGTGSGSSTYSWINQVPSPENTLNAAVTFMDENQGCGSYSYDSKGTSHPFNTKLKKLVKEYRRTMLDLANTSNYYSDLTHLCSDVAVDEATWNFSQCTDLQNSYSYNYGSSMPPGLPLCWQTWDFTYLGLTEDRDGNNDWVSGRYKSEDDVTLANKNIVWDRWFLGERCASDLTAFDAAVAGYLDEWGNVNASDQAAYDAEKINFYHNCQKTTGNIDGSNNPTLAGQIAYARKMSLKWDVPAKTLICGSSSSALANKVLSSAENSCMPDVYLMPFCDMTGNCMEALRCPGSSSGGKCFKDGSFIGQVPGRLGLMSLKPRVNDAFEMSQISLDTWNMWDNTSQKMLVCEMTSTTILNARKKSASEFDTIFKVTQNENCEDQETANGSSTDSAGGTTTAGAGGTGGTSTGMGGGGGDMGGMMSKQTLGNILKKFNFKKCAQEDCSGE